MRGEDFVEAGAFDRGDWLLAARMARITGEQRAEVAIAAAACLAELRRGSVCLLLDSPPSGEADPPVRWPDAEAWRSVLVDSPMVRVGLLPSDRPLRLVEDRVYLQRFWQDEEVIRSCAAVAADTTYPADQVAAAVARVFAADGAATPEQRQAAVVAASSRIMLLAGGPGTGKTWTVARILAVLADLAGTPLQVAVAAPTGKAATRLQEAIATQSPAAAPDWIRTLQPSTIHRMLRRRPGTREAFRYNRDNRLPYDVVVVDEMSMVSLPLLARLMEAVGPRTRLILVGDPDQLASVEAGAVFGDLVRMRQGGDGLVKLEHNHRFSGQLQRLARAVRDGQTEQALAALESAAPGETANVAFIESADGRAAFDEIRDEVARQAVAVDTAADNGDADAALAELSAFRVLCAHREGLAGVTRWSGLIERWSAQATGRPVAAADAWYVGRPLLVNRNDYDLNVFNGETGVVVQREAGPMAVIDQGSGRPEFSPFQLSDVQSMHAMTVHKAQGSQYRRVTVVLPPPASPLLTRELLYTAITRSQDAVRIVGTREAFEIAVSRGVRRASGLGR